MTTQKRTFQIANLRQQTRRDEEFTDMPPVVEDDDEESDLAFLATGYRWNQPHLEG